jgi:hypothetical protein
MGQQQEGGCLETQVTIESKDNQQSDAESRKRKKREQMQRWRKSHPEIVREQARRHYKKHRERLIDKSRAWRAANLERCRETSREWGRKNPEKRALKDKKWREEHQAYAKERHLRWCFNNPDKVTEHAHRRRRRLRGLTVLDVPAYNRKVRHIKKSPIIECLYCGVSIPLGPRRRHIDHIIPLAMGGLDCAENIGPACARCNLQKHATHPLIFWARKASTLLEEPLVPVVAPAVPGLLELAAAASASPRLQPLPSSGS